MQKLIRRLMTPTNTKTVDRASLEGLLLRRFFYAPSFEIYGGVRGLFDYGPPGSALQANLISLWRQHFIIEEEMLELDTTIMTPEPVLKTSGHVDKFTDWMVSDSVTKDVFRADHLVEGALEGRLEGDQIAREIEAGTRVLEKRKKAPPKLDDATKEEYEKVLAQIDNFDGAALDELIRKYQILAPETNNPLTPARTFNLMFESSIGPTGTLKGYLRPETAQGQFMNFNRLLEFNNGHVPFASAQIGKSFRNEISPRQGLLRVREFAMAEVEHYVDPKDKSHPRFAEVKDVKARFLPREVQQNGSSELTEMTIGEAVESRMVDNETLGYFLGRILLFFHRIGANYDQIRFRQHMANEMAHYASDCWDTELLTSYGWIECTGCADRSAYDLTVHQNKTKTKLLVREPLPEPKVYEAYVPVIQRKIIGPKFGPKSKDIVAAIESWSQEQLEAAAQSAAETYSVALASGETIDLPKEALAVERQTIKESVREYIPNVIEPSFGIGRILYCLLEHAFYARAEDAQRGVLRLPVAVAPIKALIVPISSNPAFKPTTLDISRKLRAAGVSSRTDDSNVSIGKRYSRNDELGTPYGITVDFATLKNGTVTVRERDSTKQLIGSLDDIIALVADLSHNRTTWADASSRFAAYDGQQDV